jgi:murein DD-endopeptidase MepM/ murein hydrolase activator NlpD
MSLELHSGIDIAAPEGTVVRAAKSGRVRATGYTETAGQYVELVHLLGFTTYYSHLSRVETRDGAIRLKWSRVGRVGATGRATGSHLHFELRWLGLRLPPRPFLLFSGIRHRIGERIGL